jgi:Family of unknown function (DUF6527)
MTLQYKFVDNIPEDIPNGCIFISIKYKTAVHKCVCGCGSEVVTPISPTDWQLTFDGVSVSLSPSIGNWNFECRSHYWIVKNEIEHSYKWDEKEINMGRKKNAATKRKFFSKRKGKNGK